MDVQASSQEKSGAVTNISAVGGVGAVLSAGLTWQSANFQPETVTFLQAMIPVVSAVAGEIIRCCVNMLNEKVANSRIQRVKAQAKQVIDDPIASADVKERAQRRYDYYCELEFQLEASSILPASREATV